jgi:hypothetical protein
MELVLRGEVDPVPAEALEEEQAEEEAGWEVRDQARALEESVCVPAVEQRLPIRRD